MGTRPYFVDIDLNQNQMQFAVLHTLASPPSGGSEVDGQLYYDTGSNTPFFWNGSSWTSMSSAAASSVPFSGVTTATNISETLTLGTGGALTFSGEGIVNANQLVGYDIDTTPPTDGQILLYQGGSIDAWQAVDTSAIGANLDDAIILTPTTTSRNTIKPTSGNMGLTVISGDTGGGNQVIFAAQTDVPANLFLIDNNFGDYRAYFTGELNFVSVDAPLQVRGGNAFQLFNSGDVNNITLSASAGLTTSYTLTLPLDAGATGEFLKNTGSGITDWSLISIADISDFDIDNPQDGDFLVYEAGSIDAWQNRTLATLAYTDRPQQWTAANQFDDFSITGVGGRHTFTSARTAGGLVELNNVDGEIPIISTATDNNGDVLVRDGEGFEERPLVEADISDLGSYITDLSGFDTGDLTEGINLYFTDERVDDRVAALIQDGTGLTWTYVDGSNTLTGNVSLSSFDTGDLSEGSNLYYTDERVDDRVAALIQDGTGIAWTYDDGANTLTANVSIASYDLDDLSDVVITGTPADNEILAYDSGGNWINQTAAEAGLAEASHTHVSTEVTDFAEAVDDRVDTLIQDGTGLTWTYVDGSNTLTGNVSLSSFDTGDLSEGSNLYYTDERVDDRVAALIQDGTGITWTYDDGANTLTANVSVASYDLNDLADVVITGTPADNEILAYDSGGNWINQTAAEAGLAAGTGTSGEVAYWNGVSSLTSDSNFLYDGTNVNIDGGELRITNSTASLVVGKDRAGGASAPINIINDGGSPEQILFEHYYSGATTSNELKFIRSRGSEASKTAVGNTDELGVISFYGYNTSSTSVEGAYIVAKANEAWGGAAAGTQLEFYVTTTSSPSSASRRFTISSEGLTSTVQFLSSNGVEGAPAYSFSLDDDTGMYRSADNEVSITAGGSDVATFTGGTLATTFAGDVTANGDMTVVGDLLVSGSTTTINTTNLIVEDNFIIVNSMGVVQDAGIEVERGNTGSGDNAYLRFSEIVNEWFVDNGSVSHLVARKHAEEITGDDVSTSFDIDHNMGTLYVMVQVFDSTTGKQVEVDVDIINTTRVTLEFNAAPTSGDSYRIIVVG